MTKPTIAKTSTVDVERIYRFYESYTQQQSIGIGWSSLEAAYRCYEAASSHSWQNWSQFTTVLDVGCGHALLNEYLREARSFDGCYTGIEVFTPFFEAAHKRLGPQKNVELRWGEFSSTPFESSSYDWVFSLGSLAVIQDDQKHQDRLMITKMVELARQGVSIYVNDNERFPPARRDQYQDLATHDLSELVSLLESFDAVKQIDVQRVDASDTYRTLVHASIGEG